TPEQRRSAERVNPWRQPAIIQHNFRTIDPLLRWFFNPASLLGSIGWGGPSPDPAHSPVLFIGDSFNWGLTPRVSRGLSLPVGEGHGPGQTTEAFKGFLRDPELLKDCKVMVWVVCNTQLTLSSWPLPRPIRESLPK
ncbi:MAG: hypothetical protein JO112_02045, partial [Planctomycetes bacterium]|nr:hypothetical protein [Planctomycetota bacterium]